MVESTGKQPDSSSSGWLIHLKRWIYHTAWATLGAIVFGMLPAVPFLVVNLLMMNRLKTIESITDKLTNPPYCPLCLLSAFVIANIIGRQKPGLEATLVWVLPMILLAIGILSWNAFPGQGSWSKDVWDNYLGKNCGGSDCVYELALTEPFLTSISYTLGACSAIVRSRSRS
jgi:hypothetical protein